MSLTQSEIDAARARVPLAFQAPLPVRIRRYALWAFFIGLFCWCLYDFNM